MSLKEVVIRKLEGLFQSTKRMERTRDFGDTISWDDSEMVAPGVLLATHCCWNFEIIMSESKS